jgi:uncharacterized membrane protein required for colicin V production
MVIDILLLVFALAGFWLGYSKGIVSTLFSILGYLIALLITLIFSPWLTGLLIKSFDMHRFLALVLNTFFFFLASIFLIKWLGKKWSNFLNRNKTNKASKIQGGIVMMLMGILVYSFLILMVNSFGLVSEKIKLASISYQTLEVIPLKSRALVSEFKPIFNRYWELMQDSVSKKETPAVG